MERISVFIDGANFYHGMKKVNKKYSDFYFHFKKYINKVTKGKKLVKVFYFNAPLKQQLNRETYIKQQLLFQRLRKWGYEVILCKRKKRVDKDGEETHKIKEDDIRLALEMYKGAWKNDFDIAYLFSGDGDFAPLIEYLSEKNKKIKVFYFQGCESLTLLKNCGYNAVKIDRKIINQNYDRGAYILWQKRKLLKTSKE